MKLFVKTLSGKTVDLEVPGPQTSVAMLAKLLQISEAMPAGDMCSPVKRTAANGDAGSLASLRFIFQGQELEYGKTLADYRIKPQSSIDCVERMRYERSLSDDDFLIQYMTEAEKAGFGYTQPADEPVAPSPVSFPGEGATDEGDVPPPAQLVVQQTDSLDNLESMRADASPLTHFQGDAIPAASRPVVDVMLAVVRPSHSRH